MKMIQMMISWRRNFVDQESYNDACRRGISDTCWNDGQPFPPHDSWNVDGFNSVMGGSYGFKFTNNMY